MGKYHRLIHAMDDQTPFQIKHDQNSKHLLTQDYEFFYVAQNMAYNTKEGPEHHFQCPAILLSHFL